MEALQASVSKAERALAAKEEELRAEQREHMRLLHRLESAELTGVANTPPQHSWRPPRHPDVKGLEAFWAREIGGAPLGTGGAAAAAPAATDRSDVSTQSGGEWPAELHVG